MLNLFLPITKIDAAKRLVYGTIAEEVPDKAGEILDYATARPAFERWSGEIATASSGRSMGNVRAMHGKVAAGKLEAINFDDDLKRIEGVARIVDDDEWKKVEEGVYTGFSIGGRYARRWPDPGNAELTRYTPELSEISLVDNPCIPTATFAVIKADGSTELRKFKRAGGGTAPTPEVRQGWQAADGSFHATKAEALRRNAGLEDEAGAEPVAAAAIAKAEATGGDAHGDIAYADPGYQHDRKQRYPIDTVPHIRAAWVFINRDNNRRRYTATQLEAVRARIIAAWRQKIDPDGPPSAGNAQPAGKSQFAGGLRKDLDTVARIACLLGELDWLRQSLAEEALAEGDESTAPDRLEAIIAELADFLRGLVAEETAELLDEDDDDDDDAGTPQVVSPAITDLARMTAERDALAKLVAGIAPQLEAIERRLARIEAQPAAPRGTLRAVAKGEDGTAESDPVASFERHLARLDPQARTLALTKLALANPQRIG